MKIHIKPHSPGIKDTACKDTKGIFLNDNNTGIKIKKNIFNYKIIYSFICSIP